jgi:hypothetical protein
MNIQARFKIDYKESLKGNDESFSNSMNNVIFNTRKTNRNLSTYQLIQQRQLQKKQFYNKVLEAYKKKIDNETNNKIKEFNFKNQQTDKETEIVFELKPEQNEEDILNNFSLLQDENIELPIIDLLEKDQEKEQEQEQEQKDQEVKLDILGDTWEIESTKSDDTETDILNNITEVVVQDKIL